MYILGISCFYHDSAVALLKDGQLVAAAMEERFTRKKNDNGFPYLAIEFCLRKAGITSRPGFRCFLRKTAGQIRAHPDQYAGRVPAFPRRVARSHVRVAAAKTVDQDNHPE